MYLPASTPPTAPPEDVYCHPEACTQEPFVRVVESVPTALRRVEPEYPAEALADGLEGSVVVEADLGVVRTFLYVDRATVSCWSSGLGRVWWVLTEC
jgi:hypothetical protein